MQVLLHLLYIFAPLMENFELHNMESFSGDEKESPDSTKGGFYSPVEEKRERLDLVRLLVKHKASTFFFRANGVALDNTAINEGDIIIVDRAIDPYNNCKAVCYIDGEYTVKRVEMSDKGVRLMPANEHNTTYKPIEVSPDNEFLIWGVVTYVIKKM